MSSTKKPHFEIPDRQKAYGLADRARVERREEAEATRSQMRKQNELLLDSGAGKWRYRPRGSKDDTPNYG